MRRSLLFLSVFSLSAGALANTQFFAIVANAPEVQQLEQELSRQNFYLQSFERSRIQLRCLGCANVDITFRHYPDGRDARYQATVRCPLETTASCQVHVGAIH